MGVEIAWKPTSGDFIDMGRFWLFVRIFLAHVLPQSAKIKMMTSSVGMCLDDDEPLSVETHMGV